MERNRNVEKLIIIKKTLYHSAKIGVMGARRLLADVARHEKLPLNIST